MGPPPTPPPRPRNAAATHARLLRAAVELFPELGYEATTTPRLSARAGVAEGTIYRHFEDKAELFNAAYRGVAGWVLETWRSSGELEHRTVREGLRQTARLLANSSARDPAAARMFLYDWPSPLLDNASRDARRQVYDILVSLMATGKQEGSVRSGPAELWAGLRDTVIRSGLQRIAAREWGPEHPNFLLLL